MTSTLAQYDWYPYKKGEKKTETNTEIDTSGASHVMTEADLSDVFPSQERPRIAGNTGS